MQPIVLTIAGSDSSGGAGIQADIKAIAANGGYGASVITAVTAQNTLGVWAVEAVSPALVRAQLEAVFDDLKVAAIKTGMLANASLIQAVAEGLRRVTPICFVCDPVMISKSGFPLLAPECVATLRHTLLPLASLITPNVAEAEALSGIPIVTLDDAIAAGRSILKEGATAVLVKGGHLSAAPATDVLVTADGAEILEGTWIDTRHTHGTGCTYSAAIATQLAHGLPLREAVQQAKTFLTAAIRAGWAVGQGPGPTDPFFFLHGPDREGWLLRLQNHAKAGVGPKPGSAGPPPAA